MNPMSFYATDDRKEAVLLTLISKALWQDEHQLIEEKCLLKPHDFHGEAGEMALIRDKNQCLTHAFIGTGEASSAQALAHASLLLPTARYRLTDKTLSASTLAFWALAQYRYDAFKPCGLTPKILLLDNALLPEVELETTTIFLVRDLINAPANLATPAFLSETMQTLAKNHQATFKQWVGEDLLTHHFPAIHAVGRASIHPPRFLSLTWGNPSHPSLVLIGKGVCFDSGGLNIKPAQGMRLMKKDMGGAAHALGLAHLIMAKQLPVSLTLLIPAVENAIGGDAFRPSDILVMRNKLSVEIDNTDAEGRLILADALAYACEQTPDLIIDFATLTGAARIALGTDIACMFSNEQALADDVLQAAKQTDEAIWQLPLHLPYESLLSSNVADIANSSNTSFAGAITAALFLNKFVLPSTPWLHFDVMAWNLVAKPGKPEGGEALAVRAVFHYLKKRFGHCE
tara:strand:+ start:354 stop:1727 length:1374 start_codon:yes stop_codon:yes gene_type:complete